MTVPLSPDQTVHAGVLRVRRGAAVSIPYRLRFLGTDDLPALEAFRSFIFDQLPDIDAYFPETPEFAGLHLGERGVILGLEAEGRLIGCAILGLPQPGMPAFVEDLPQPRPAVTATAHMASCMIHPDFRGNGLQRLLVAMRTLHALGAGRTQLFSRVALSNPLSLSNLLAGGFVVRRVLTMHSGRLRYLLHRDMGAPPPAWIPGSERVFAIPEVEEQRLVIEAGWIGAAVDLSGPVPLVTYTRPAVAAVAAESRMEAVS
ncbi:GNAT family N-acetyltransferase [Azospirillum canadense]|uniref:GNAT family N-acetyltransferase n=1 Tax=Azospirillum canadense TaxID=403962 RepID=UPI002227F5EE|nr:GNAT family N-acetyltransferase [Azospirillum canadense]MCW2242989.1 GNAT superfamily N-acetyltransferase [Azospirillum canadense]